MAELIGYTLLNGTQGKSFEYYKQVNSQVEVEECRRELEEKHPNKEIRFTTREKIQDGRRTIAP